MVSIINDFESALLNLTKSGSNIVIVDECDWVEKNKSNLISNGFTLVYIDEFNVADTNKDYIALERALQVASGFRGCNKIYVTKEYNSRFDMIININNGQTIRIGNKMWTGVNLFGMYFHGLAAPTVNRINDISTRANEYFGHRIRDAIMLYCKRERMTYVGLGDEHESVDSGMLTRCRCRHYGSVGTYPEGSTKNYATHPIVLKLLEMIIFGCLLLKREEVYIVHVGNGSMNDLGIPSQGIIARDDTDSKLTIIDPPWGGFDYWYSTIEGELTISGPRYGVRRIIPRWGPDPIEFESKDITIEEGGNILDYGAGDYFEFNDKFDKYDPNVRKFKNKPMKKYDVVLLRHVLHHVKDIPLLFDEVFELCKDIAFIYIKDHDVTSSSLAYWLMRYHLKFSRWNNYYEKYFSFYSLIEYLNTRGLETIMVQDKLDGFRSGWMKFKFIRHKMIRLPLTPLLRICNKDKKQIFKLPYNYDFKVPIGWIRIVVPAFFLYLSPSISWFWMDKDFGWDYDYFNGVNWIRYERKAYLPKTVINTFIRKVPNNDLLSIESWRDDMLVGTWSVSNTINPRPVEFIRMLVDKTKVTKSSFIMLFPRCTQAKFQLVSNRLDGHGIMRDGDFYDWTAEPEFFLALDVNVMSLQRLLMCLERKQDGSQANVGDVVASKNDVKGKLVERLGIQHFDTNHPKMHLWFAVVSTDLFDFRFETIQGQQPIGIKLSGQMLREFGHEDKAWQYMLRKKILSMWLTGVKISLSTFMDGIYNGFKIITSGHIINMLLSSKIRVVDWKVYMRTIENNILIRRDQKLRKDYLLKFKDAIITETYRDLPLASWHNYYDIMNGVATYIVLCMMLKIRVNYLAVKYICAKSVQFKCRYKIFSYQYPDAELRNIRQ